MRPWRKKLWGVVSGNRLLGRMWHSVKPTPYPGEPSHALTFCTRTQAREWCREQDRKYAQYPEGHVCRSWRFHPVRVVETVAIVRRLTR